MSSDNVTKQAWVPNVPCQQPYFEYSTAYQQWRSDTVTVANTKPADHGDKFAVVTWNIDFNLPVAEQRMLVALQQVEQIVTTSVVPCIIFFQEMVASDLEIIQKQPWIRSNFILTDVSPEHWESDDYGTCTLISKEFRVLSVFRVHYGNTSIERDALFVDVGFRNDQRVRFCNTHLESFIMDPPKRPQQLEMAAKHMHDQVVYASVLGGDLNAIEGFDDLLPASNGLQDAYLASGGQQRHGDAGCTWGHMARTATREQFGLGRLDKLLFCGGLNLEAFGLFGLGLEVPDADDRKLLVEEGLEAGWITDHLGLKADFVLT